MTKVILLILTIPLSLLTISCTTIESAARPAPSVETTQNELGCGHSVEGSQSKNFSLPDRLCYDASKPIDKSEDIDPQDGETPPNLYSREDLNYQDLPAEVRETVELMFGEKFQTVEFELLVVPAPDAAIRNRTVKSYKFWAQDKVSNTLAVWIFHRQGGSLKFKGAVLD